MELDASSMEKRFASKFLKKILKYVDSAQEFIAHLGKYHCDISPKCVLPLIFCTLKKNVVFLYQGMMLSYCSSS